MYTIQIKETRSGEISFDTIEEAKQWYKDREGDVYWYHDDERCNLEKEIDEDVELTAQQKIIEKVLARYGDH